MIREILYPKKVDFSFTNDTYKFVLGMMMIFVIYIIILIPRMN